LGEQVLARVASGAAEQERARAPRPSARRVGQQAKEEGTVRYSSVKTELGQVYLAYGPRGIRMVAPAERPETFVAAYARRFGGQPLADEAPPRRLLASVERALAGDRQAARRLSLDLESLGSFEQAVLKKALEIPRGEVRTYGWVAREIGRPTASRAVGHALGRNPIPFIIPCHRVVGRSGSLTGYAFGVPMKRRILTQEGVDPAELEQAARRGEQFRGSRTTRIFCLPTCRHARRVQPANLVSFSDEVAARAAGYRPCRVCRPAAVG
jgi:O-6-methylguanine DNA methyltransferase